MDALDIVLAFLATITCGALFFALLELLARLWVNLFTDD